MPRISLPSLSVSVTSLGFFVGSMRNSIFSATALSSKYTVCVLPSMTTRICLTCSSGRTLPSFSALTSCQVPWNFCSSCFSAVAGGSLASASGVSTRTARRQRIVLSRLSLLLLRQMLFKALGQLVELLEKLRRCVAREFQMKVQVAIVLLRMRCIEEHNEVALVE